MVEANPPNAFEMVNVDFAHRGGAGLRDLELTLATGRFYGLIGPNGSGKTTLISLLAGSRQPDCGSISLLGKDLQTYSKASAARISALVPQNFSMEFDFTVFEVVMMGRHPYIPRFASPESKDVNLVEEALATLDIRHLRDRYVTNLSGGERQRVLVARALAQNTPVLLLDEATANLDVRHSIDIMRALRHRVEENCVTVVAAIHDLDLAAAFCDELIVLDRGAVRASGSVGNILNQELLRDTFGVEARVVITEDSSSPHIQYRYTHVA